jgi:hypothetical protein
MLFCFTNICAKYFTLNFRLDFLHQAPYFGAVLPKAVAIKASKIMCAKAAVLLR